MSATTRSVLVMEFYTGEGKAKSIRVSDPKDDLTAEVVESAMEIIADLHAFNSISGDGPASLKGAKNVQTVTSDFNIVVG